MRQSKIIGILILSIAPLIWFLVNHFEQKEQEEIYQERLAIIDKLKHLDLANIPSEKLEILNDLDPAILAAGKSEMLRHKIVIVGIARDNIDDLLVTVKTIKMIGDAFQDYRVIIFENDSKDGTDIALATWQAQDPKVRVILKNFNNRKRPSHKFMADVRNNYLNALKDPEYNDFDIVMAIDMDMSYGLDIRGIYDSFAKISRWDTICSNGIANAKGQMYDMFAFRNDEFPYSSRQWQEICLNKDERCEKGKDYSRGFIHDLIAFRGTWQANDRLYWLLIAPQGQKVYPVKSDLIPVASCFGGMAFYKHEFIANCYYDSVDNDCEHVAFHQCLRDSHQGRMFMNPAQVIRYSQYK